MQEVAEVPKNRYKRSKQKNNDKTESQLESQNTKKKEEERAKP